MISYLHRTAWHTYMCRHVRAVRREVKNIMQEKFELFYGSRQIVDICTFFEHCLVSEPIARMALGFVVC